FVALEMPSNPYLTEFYLNGMVAEMVIVFIVILLGHFITARTGVGAAIAVFIMFFIGLAEYFVVTFKDTPIMASDIFALGTAATVSGNYTYLLDERCVMALALVAFIVILVSYMPKPKAKGPVAVVACLVAAIALGAGSAYAVTHVSFRRDLHIYPNGWQPLRSYWRWGFLSAFISNIQELEPEMPEGYTNEAAEASILSRAASYDEQHADDEAYRLANEQFMSEKPCVIVIMNETFADMSIYDGLHAGYQGPVRFFQRDGALMRGRLMVSPYGGGTCNSEYEFLTGCSMGFLSPGVYPFLVYKLDGVENMAAQFAELGYATTAMHPNRRTNWNRDVVFDAMGFDRFLDILDFTGAPRLRGKVTDEATYDRILRLLEEDPDTPQFIFDVTMQNHSAYDTGLLPESMIRHYYVEGEDDPVLDEYLALMEESDRALDAVLDSLEELDRPVVVLFFGDHQPNIARGYNDLIFRNELQDLAHEQRVRETVYMVWTNYDVAGWDGTTSDDMFSCNYFGPRALRAIGAPLSDFQRAQLVMSQEIPLINRMGYMDAMGAWHDLEDLTPAYEELWMQHYYQVFAHGVRYQVGSGIEGMV
ncbi:MAG: LTA synthase family protein, partial [Atopobiaceae bacterium]|nr:LTA synthase family protein [Atopobiaceae bacterium]